MTGRVSMYVLYDLTYIHVIFVFFLLLQLAAVLRVSLVNNSKCIYLVVIHTYLGSSWFAPYMHLTSDTLYELVSHSLSL